MTDIMGYRYNYFLTLKKKSGERISEDEASEIRRDLHEVSMETFDTVDNMDKGLELAVYDVKWSTSVSDVVDFSRKHPDLRIRFECEYEEYPAEILIIEDGMTVQDCSPVVLRPAENARFSVAVFQSGESNVTIIDVLDETFRDWEKSEGLEDSDENFAEFVRSELVDEYDEWRVLDSPRSIERHVR